MMTPDIPSSDAPAARRGLTIAREAPGQARGSAGGT